MLSPVLRAEDGYKLWLRYEKIENEQLVDNYKAKLSYIFIPGEHPIFESIKKELSLSFEGALGFTPTFIEKVRDDSCLIIGTLSTVSFFEKDEESELLKTLGSEGYHLSSVEDNNKSLIVLGSQSEIGTLYGTFQLIRLIQTQQSLNNLNIADSPKIQNRILNHWDNLDRTVERGYSGFSIWDWHKLPDFIDTRYIDYARANASIGINGAVLTNVNANSLVLTESYIIKLAALANVFRSYGIKVYLTARFSSPIEIGGLKTADPHNKKVQEWWKKTTDLIYEYIPDFGGYLVKANSEGQPGPQNYKRNHADGANMLADAVAPYRGLVMWRAFVYSHEVDEDRAKQANIEFEPLDGEFRDNVLIQVKNGAIDFQPREPFHPLFGAMPKTSLALELQITQEYLGQGTHLVYLAPLYKECLESNTYRPEAGTTVAQIIDGSSSGYKHTTIAGVANIGTDRNWTGHHFGQANWYAFGRLAWNHKLSSDAIAEEWIGMSFGTNPKLVSSIKEIMLPSRDVCVNYMTPLGLHHIMGWDHHYGPGPWVNIGRPDWTSLYYHQADKDGIGFDRTESGSNALSQYAPEINEQYSNLETCPEKYLLWFHHLNWDYTTKSGRSLWNEIVYRYYKGADDAAEMLKQWELLEQQIDKERYQHVHDFLTIQSSDAIWWRNACVLYFQQFSGQPIPEEFEKPDKTLEYYQKLSFPYAPGISPKWL